MEATAAVTPATAASVFLLALQQLGEKDYMNGMEWNELWMNIIRHFSLRKYARARKTATRRTTTCSRYSSRLHI